MSSPAKKADAGFAQRLKAAIRETGMTQDAFAASIDTTGHNISRWVTGVQAPDAPGMAKLAKGLKGRFIWVLTGEEETAIEQRTVGSLSPQLREVVTLAEPLSQADQDTLAALARTLASPDRPNYTRLIDNMIGHVEGLDLTLEEGRDMRASAPDPGSKAPLQMAACQLDDSAARPDEMRAGRPAGTPTQSPRTE